MPLYRYAVMPSFRFTSPPLEGLGEVLKKCVTSAYATTLTTHLVIVSNSIRQALCPYNAEQKFDLPCFIS